MAKAMTIFQQSVAQVVFAETGIAASDKKLQTVAHPICRSCRANLQARTHCSLRSSLSEDNRPGSNPGLKLQRTRNVLESVYQMSAAENPRDPVLTNSQAREPRVLTASAPIDSAQRAGSSCSECDSDGSVECLTCSGSGLYVEPCLESHGVIVKVTCLGCGGSGRILCPYCGGRRHQ